MSTADRRNRARWSADQQKKARAQAPIRDYDAERAQKLEGLRALAAQLEELPHMTSTLIAVRAEIARLS